MPNPNGMIHGLRKQVAKLGEAIEELGSELADAEAAAAAKGEKLSDCAKMFRALKNPDMLVDGAPFTLDRIQVMENGDIREIPPPPEMTCIKEVTKEFSKNGKKEKEAVLVNDPA